MFLCVFRCSNKLNDNVSLRWQIAEKLTRTSNLFDRCHTWISSKRMHFRWTGPDKDVMNCMCAHVCTKGFRLFCESITLLAYKLDFNLMTQKALMRAFFSCCNPFSVNLLEKWFPLIASCDWRTMAISEHCDWDEFRWEIECILCASPTLVQETWNWKMFTFRNFIFCLKRFILFSYKEQEKKSRRRKEIQRTKQNVLSVHNEMRVYLIRPELKMSARHWLDSVRRYSISTCFNGISNWSNSINFGPTTPK